MSAIVRAFPPALLSVLMSRECLSSGVLRLCFSLVEQKLRLTRVKFVAFCGKQKRDILETGNGNNSFTEEV
jgi:hypothetical protein